MKINRSFILSQAQNLIFLRSLLVLSLFVLSSTLAKATPYGERETSNTVEPNYSPQTNNTSFVSGVVKDETGEVILGATIRIKGVDGGAVTDFDGKFQIKVNNPNALLIVSFVGMKEKELSLNGQTNVVIVLESTTEALDEIVVVGYGEQKKESVVAAISSISAQEIVSTPTSNIVSGLAGKMPGLSVMIKDGELGSENMQTLIRGQATTNNSAPLILVDGVERGITTIDPYDVESISVLKDASATAVFGVRGANGVILVTTKKGIVGKPKVTANMNYSLQNATRLPEPMNAFDYMTTRNQVISQYNESMGQSSPLPFSQGVFDNYTNGVLPEYYVDRDFFGEFINKNVPMLKGNVNIRGGDKKTKYFASVGYMQQGGPFKTESWDEYNYDNEERLNRFTYRANIDMQITESLKGWVNLSGYLQDKNDPMIYLNNSASHYGLLMASMADIPSISFPDLNYNGDVVSAAGYERTPYGMLNRTGYRISTTNTLNTTIGLQQKLDKLSKGLSLKAVVSYDANAIHKRGFGRTYQTYNGILDETGPEPTVEYALGSGSDSELSSMLSQSFTTNFDLQASVNYNRKFNDAHNVTGLLLYNQNQRVINVQVPYNYVGIVGRATYGYANKYLAELNFGMNGSEQFAEGKRFGFFPSASAGWVLSEEAAVKNIAAIDFLKLRASFGQVGNDKMLGYRFVYLDNWAQGTAAGTANPSWLKGLGNTPGLPNPVYEETMPNQNVSWEVANKYNIGLESRFYDGFEWDVDVFYEKRNSILINDSDVPVFYFGNTKLPPTNSGVMTNRGFETTLSYSKSINKDLFLGARLSVSYARNRIEAKNETPSDDTYAYPYKAEGYSTGMQWGYDCLGFFESQSEIDGWADQTGLAAVVLPGDLKYRDANEDGVIDVKDYVPMDYPNVPEYNYSATLFGNYKGFDFNILVNAVNNYSYNIAGRGMTDWFGNSVGNYKNYFNHHADAWTPQKAASGADYWYPRMYPDGVSCSNQPSNFWIRDVWYLRLKNVEVGYTLPKTTLNKIGMDKIRVFFTGSNLAMIDNLPVKTIDPEVSNSLSHPIYSTYNFGLNVTF